MKTIIEKVDLQTIKLNEETKHTHAKKSFWASDALKCTRKVYYEYKHRDEAEEFETRILRVFQNGNDVHERLTMYLDKSGLLEGEEVDIPKNKHNVTGRVDALLKDGTIVEFKSINSRSVSKPMPEHVGQIMLYLYLFGETADGPRDGILLYECKPNQKLYEFHIELDMDMINDILADFTYVSGCLAKEEAPERKEDCKQHMYPCRYCNYRKLCFKE